MESILLGHLDFYPLSGLSYHTLKISSDCLRGNPWGDPVDRFLPVLLPRSGVGPWPCVFYLSGFGSNGPQHLAPKAFQKNLTQTLDALLARGEAPTAVYVFVDATTFWGGSQFINSLGMGRYEDYLMQEVVPQIKALLPVKKTPDNWCVAGGSSGGYGAFHLASKFPEVFGLIAALAPDSFFDFSLLPAILDSLPTVEKYGLEGIESELLAGKFMQKRDAHMILDVIAMGLCYSPRSGREIEWPVDVKTGQIIPEVWAKWKAHDPIEFLSKRKDNLKKIKKVYLDTGTKDQFRLQYGARQIRDILQTMKVTVDYSEFDGNHFDLSSQLPKLWSWLKTQWS